MGEHIAAGDSSATYRRSLAARLLDDLQALRFMQEHGHFESGVRRIGAEQEFCLVDSTFRPSILGTEVLAEIADSHFTTELALYTLEANLDPLPLSGNAISKLHQQLDQLLRRATEAAERFNNHIVLTGILPSIGLSEMDSRWMTPSPRYAQLERRIRELRNNEGVELYIQGIDDLMMRHDSILFEACNTSFQTHLQIDPDQFVDQYNWAQAIAGPVLSVAVNSPLLFGRELWSETRIALFQQSVDTRSRDHGLRQRQARVYFGNRWIHKGISELFEEDIARYPLILDTIAEDSLQQLARGEVARLKALALHNGTIWKWNRPCFGSDGKIAHLRIENRYLPSGPTTTDEIANAAFWIGLMCGMPDEYREIWNVMDFREAKENFLKAAQHGLDVELSWLGKSINARQLILDMLLPMAQRGLEEQQLDSADISKYLGIIEHRAVKRMTGAQWLKLSMRTSDPSTDLLDRQIALTKQYWINQNSGNVVADWKILNLKSQPTISLMDQGVGLVMSTDLITVCEDDLLDLVIRIMQWRKIRHVPVENACGELQGLVTFSDVRSLLPSWPSSPGQDITPTDPTRQVADVMVRDPITVSPEETVKAAAELMRTNDITCLPVVRNKKLLGLVTDQDLVRFQIREHACDS